MDLKGKNVIVLGYAKTGKSVAKFLLSQNANVYIYDDNLDSIEEFNLVKNIEDYNFDLCVISPGISIFSRVVTELYAKSVPVISEIELASRFCKGKIIAVTGTNGKTTTVNLIYQILQNAKKEVYLCGNVGTPFVDIVSKISPKSYIVCEVSSYQLEAIDTFKPNISVILNITPDHILRHKTFERYYNEKLKITKNQDDKNHLIVNDNLEDIKTNANLLRFSTNKIANAYKKGEFLFYGKKKVINIHNINLIGEKNLENVLASILVSKLLKIRTRIIRKILKTFKPPSHRIETVALKKGVLYVNDSKATNISSTLCALEGFKNIVLMLGGSDKGYQFDDIVTNSAIKKVIAFGETRDKVVDACRRYRVECYSAIGLTQATNLASNIAINGDVVLLSPACASFDEFSSYEERGEKFKEIVNSL